MFYAHLHYHYSCVRTLHYFIVVIMQTYMKALKIYDIMLVRYILPCVCLSIILWALCVAVCPNHSIILLMIVYFMILSSNYHYCYCYCSCYWYCYCYCSCYFYHNHYHHHHHHYYYYFHHYHHYFIIVIIENMNHEPLFMVRLWNNGMHSCISGFG